MYVCIEYFIEYITLNNTEIYTLQYNDNLYLVNFTSEHTSDFNIE